MARPLDAIIADLRACVAEERTAQRELLEEAAGALATTSDVLAEGCRLVTAPDCHGWFYDQIRRRFYAWQVSATTLLRGGP